MKGFRILAINGRTWRYNNLLALLDAGYPRLRISSGWTIEAAK